MAGVKKKKKMFFQCFFKAMGKNLKRNIDKFDSFFKFTCHNKKIIKHTVGTLAITVIIIGMALPNTYAADAKGAYQTSDVQPAVALTNDALEAELSDFAVYGMYINEDQDSVEEPVISDIGNNGYPYAKKATEGVTLAIKLSEAVETATFQWQYSDDKSQWQSIEGATKQIFENASPKDGRWYRCIVNGSESMAVQVVGQFKCEGKSETDSQGRIWTNPIMPWYISNGSVAYGINSEGTAFDVVGLYNKSGKDYMLQTSYNKGWTMVTSSSDAPANDYEVARLDDFIVGFDASDDYELYIDVDLAEGYTAFSFGCDTMLGNDATSKAHSDFAALEVNKKADNTIENIAMVGARSSSQAAGSNPGFVITPITCDELEFWLGPYNERKYFNFNSGTGNITVDGEYFEGICTESQGIDSGMTMSWFNVPEDESIRFMFSVGSASSIGVTTNSGTINYTGELIEGLRQNTDYLISVEGTEGTYAVRSNALGHITFSGVDTNGSYFDFAGKNIHIVKDDGESAEINISINSRPYNVQEIPDSDEVVSIGDTTIDITVSLGSLQLFAQEYRICDEFGKEIEGFGWTRISGDGRMSFTGLKADSVYTIIARVYATENTPASIERLVYKFKTN